MSEQELLVSEPEAVPPYDPQARAEGQGLTLLGFLGPWLVELDQWLDKRLIGTLVPASEAMLTFRDRINGLVLSELGAYLDPIGEARGKHTPESEARTAQTAQQPSASAVCGGEPESRVEQWESQGEEGLLIWESSVWEKPESLTSEGLGPVQSRPAKRVTPVKPGSDPPPGKPICVPGLHGVGVLLEGASLTEGPAVLVEGPRLACQVEPR